MEEKFPSWHIWDQTDVRQVQEAVESGVWGIGGPKIEQFWIASCNNEGLFRHACRVATRPTRSAIKNGAPAAYNVTRALARFLGRKKSCRNDFVIKDAVIENDLVDRARDCLAHV